jgi:hypothetical protein
MLVVRVTENVPAVQSSYYSSCPWPDTYHKNATRVGYHKCFLHWTTRFYTKRCANVSEFCLRAPTYIYIRYTAARYTRTFHLLVYSFEKRNCNLRRSYITISASWSACHKATVKFNLFFGKRVREHAFNLSLFSRGRDATSAESGEDLWVKESPSWQRRPLADEDATAAAGLHWIDSKRLLLAICHPPPLLLILHGSNLDWITGY